MVKWMEARFANAPDPNAVKPAAADVEVRSCPAQ
jgi:hypothetical protein